MLALASALLTSAYAEPWTTLQTSAGTLKVIKDETSAEFTLGGRLLYRYTWGYCAGIQWHGKSGADELTLIYASSCGNGVNPTWRLIVVKPDRSVLVSNPLGEVPDVQISQLGEQITFAYKKTIAGSYRQGQLTHLGKPVGFAPLPITE